MTMLPYQPDAVNPAIVLWFAIDGQWRRVTDLERSALSYEDYSKFVQ